MVRLPRQILVSGSYRSETKLLQWWHLKSCFAIPILRSLCACDMMFWRVLNHDWEFATCAKDLVKFASVIQVMFLGGLFVLMFLFDRTIPSSAALDAQYAISIRRFVGFATFGLFFSSMLKTQKIMVEIANINVSSVNRIHSNR